MKYYFSQQRIQRILSGIKTERHENMLIKKAIGYSWNIMRNR
ncbi:hypothetical protein BACSTE_03842 [Bacteroides stercoris ATCC 43183]|uniref:Uncharacterized protein n=1 Tax=Bacteroides stercoris ATCC 43183 TaxID=449673 RepID=B0NWF7_BACSE|nr:hypothetical protein BACSTE_03842 [Bacteroides stercoris ATCC 43183]